MKKITNNMRNIISGIVLLRLLSLSGRAEVYRIRSAEELKKSNLHPVTGSSWSGVTGCLLALFWVQIVLIGQSSLCIFNNHMKANK